MCCFQSIKPKLSHRVIKLDSNSFCIIIVIIYHLTYWSTLRRQLKREQRGLVLYKDIMRAWQPGEHTGCGDKAGNRQRRRRLQLGIGKVRLPALWGGSCSLISGRLLSIWHTQGSPHSRWSQSWQSPVTVLCKAACSLLCGGCRPATGPGCSEAQQIPALSGSMLAHSLDSPWHTHQLFPSKILHMQTYIPFVLHQPFRVLILPILPQVWAFTSH